MASRIGTIAAAAAIALGSAAASARTPAVDGVWSNPKGSVEVRTGSCGDKLCGWVVYASPKAQADAQRAGAQPLVGTALLRDYRATGASQWTGQVYVPDRKSSYYSTIQLIDAQTLKVSGCILGGLICKSQLWHRVAAPGGGAVATR